MVLTRVSGVVMPGYTGIHNDIKVVMPGRCYGIVIMVVGVLKILDEVLPAHLQRNIAWAVSMINMLLGSL